MTTKTCLRLTDGVTNANQYTYSDSIADAMVLYSA